MYAYNHYNSKKKDLSYICRVVWGIIRTYSIRIVQPAHILDLLIEGEVDFVAGFQKSVTYMKYVRIGAGLVQYYS